MLYKFYCTCSQYKAYKNYVYASLISNNSGCFLTLESYLRLCTCNNMHMCTLYFLYAFPFINTQWCGLVVFNACVGVVVFLTYGKTYPHLNNWTPTNSSLCLITVYFQLLKHYQEWTCKCDQAKQSQKIHWYVTTSSTYFNISSSLSNLQ